MKKQQQTVVITGAASGFGRALAQCYAHRGWRVALTDIDQAGLNESYEMIGGAAQGHFTRLLDVQDSTQWLALVDEVREQFGSLGVLINNAGVAAAGRVEDTPLADWEWIINIDLMGVVRGCHAFVPLLREQGSGHIVNVASFAGIAGAPQIAAYGVAKSAVIGLSELLRAELHGAGVGVSVVCPSFVKTNLMSSFRSPDAHDKSRVERWMARSGVSAVDVAEQIYRAVDDRRFMVLTHRETRWLWRLKRWLPELYFRVLMRSMRGRRDLA